MTDIGDFSRLAAREAGLVVVSTLRDDATIQSSLVNAGVLGHPVSDEPVVGFVSRGDSHKLNYLRARPRVTIVARAGWEWVAVEGAVALIGPGDPQPNFDAEQLRVLLRDIFTAAGGTHDDWDAYDKVMADERRTAVLVKPERAYSNA